MNKEFLTNRAWVELNLDNLEHNVKEIEKVISKDTKIMAVLKANAYGHDLVSIASKLNQIGITDFAVATLEEGITLREHNIQGNILILGYTSIANIKYVLKYDLMQTVVDEEYALKLKEVPNSDKLKVHIKINTGMNRIGINYYNRIFIQKLYEERPFNILGIYTHLCVCNSKKKRDILFTKLQIERFNDLITYLKSNHLEVGKTHIQSSYGILNYNEYHYDYVRAGIILYGVYNDNYTYHQIDLDLKPVLSLYAKITAVRNIKKGDTVGYGRIYKAKSDEKIAAVSIGYVDGYPKSLSGKEVYVLVNGAYAPVIGKICMDQLVINVTHIKNIEEGDIVTLIGEEKEIKAENIATILNTITPELLGRLGERLNYIIK